MADKEMKDRISDALDDALKDALAGAITILWRKITGEEPEVQAMAEFKKAVEGIRSIHEQASQIIKKIFDEA